MPGTPSGVNHSSDSQKCGRNDDAALGELLVRARAMRFCRTLPSMVMSSSDIRRSSSLSSRPLGPDRRLAPRPRRRCRAAGPQAAPGSARAGRGARGRPRSRPQNGPKPQKCQRAGAATVPECAGKGSVRSLLVVLALTASACATHHQARGLVLGVDHDARRVTVSHDAVPGFMDAMVMPFELRDPSEMTDLAAGDRIAFRIASRKGQTRIDRLQRLSAALPPAQRWRVIQQPRCPSETWCRTSL